MLRYTRRAFIGQTVAGALGWTGLRARAQQPVTIPGVELGEPIASLALRNVSVIDGIGPERVGATVVLAGNRIQSIENDSTTRLGAGVQVVNATGKFLIPGLWDMHSHPLYTLPRNSVPETGTDTAWRSQVSPLFIPNGVVATRTMGGAPAQVDILMRRRTEIRAASRLGPRLVVGSQTLAGPGLVAETARDAVRAAVKSGVDFIKVHNEVSRESYFAIVSEAKALAVPLVGHVPSRGPDPLTLRECAEAGQKSFEHMGGVFRHMFSATGVDRGGRGMGMDSLSGSQATALFDVFLANNAWLCPTLTTIFGLIGDAELASDPRLKYFDSRTRSYWASTLENAGSAETRERYQHAVGIVGAMHKAGVNILAGTDTFEPYCMPGFSVHDELRRFVDAGLRPIDALRTATYKPAEFFGMLGTVGTVEPGKLAELVLLDANPLADIRNTRKINTVFTGGRVYRREALERILAAVENNAQD